MAFSPVDSRADFPAMEVRIQEWWRQRDIFRRSVEQRPRDRLFSFYEGPPTANGSPGLHHVLARSFKDIINRYRAMSGYRVPRKGGWDTHGLPVELEVEKELGLNSKREIEAYGIEEFNRRCRESVTRYVEQWAELTDRIAFWVDLDDAYWTFSNEYIESCWWILRTLWDSDLVYQDYRSTPHCPRCGTSLSDHEVAQGYRENTVDPSVYVKFRVESGSSALKLDDGVPTFIVAWTTTPWTLPGNTALAVAGDADYALVEREGERLILAEALAERVLGESPAVIARLKGAELVGVSYAPLFDPGAWGVQARTFVDGRLVAVASRDEIEAGYTVVVTDFVSMDDGTGIVHIAPAFGGEDFDTARRLGLLFFQPVDLRGNLPAASPFGETFVKQADPKITADLQERGLLLRAETISHTYPFCWRCGTPVLYYAKPTWYIRTTAVKERLVDGNQEINWYPPHIKNGRFGNWLENNIDWAVSRERYWGTPLPVWACGQCDHVECVGSVEQLREQASDRAQAEAITDLHRPYIDEVKLRCARCGGEMTRTPEVLDAWFDSGAVPYAQWHFPFENEDTFERRFPADFICEAVDQTRGWFYSLHAESTLLNHAAPELVPSSISYRNVISLGLILDAKGEKMSTSRRNVVDPWTVIRQSGVDALRWYLFTATPAGEPRRFSPELVQETLRKFLLTLWNTYSFFVTYARIDHFKPSVELDREGLADLDRWLLSELNLLVRDATAALESYDPTDAGRAIARFVDDLSNWYVRRSRRRFWKSENDGDKMAAYQTLYTALATLSRLLAPLTPYVAEEIYRNLIAGVDDAAPESVHMADWPAVDESLIDERLSTETALVMRLASLGRSARSRARVKVRQPLGAAVVKTRSPEEGEVVSRLAGQLIEELNVKGVELTDDESAYVSYAIRPNLPVIGPKYGQEAGKIRQALAAADPATVARMAASGGPVRIEGYELEADEVLVERNEREGYAVAADAGYVVAVPTTITPALAEEGLARELVHRLQSLRKSAGFDIADRIVTYVEAPEQVVEVVRRHDAYVRQETLSEDVRFGPPEDGAHVEAQDVDGHRVTLGVRRV
ncbi:MAG: isoleucine--tRNA ligase [Dehalococcoidia bacterium]|nr:isoleucine--tRNA ligase [Dehalococcoidia bacterium]